MFRFGMLAVLLSPYNDVTDRSSPGGGALVPPEHARDIIKMVEQSSAVLSGFRRVPISTNAKSFPVLTALPEAYFIDTTGIPTSDTGLIQTTEMQWKNVDMHVAEIAVIAPFPRRLMNDVESGGINLTQELAPAIAQAIGRKVDAAVFFGTGKPAAWPAGVVTQATAAGNVKEVSATAAQGGLHADVLGLLKMIRNDGFMPDSAIGRATFEFDLLDSRDSTGQPLFIPQYEATSPQHGPLAGRLLGRPVQFATDGVFPADAAGAPQLVFFDKSKHLVGIREDMHIQIFDSGVITDAVGAVMYNLMQQDMLALRCVSRIGIAIANTVTLAESVEANRYPGGVLTSAAA